MTAQPTESGRPAAIETLRHRLEAQGYIIDCGLAATLLLMNDLHRPLLIEGEPGVGKTEIAKALASERGTKLIRLQCYEGLDTHHALYEWNYQRQLLSIKLAEVDRHNALQEDALFSEHYLLKRPLLEALTQPVSPVLLIDEIDRADEAFEAFLLELLSDFQVTIPEMGTVSAQSIPLVILTSNGTRELSDALRRRCLYHYLDFPDFEKELSIIRARLPQIPLRLAHQIVEFSQSIRRLDLRKKPGIAETLDWATALLGLGLLQLEDAGPEGLRDTLAALLKTRADHLAIDNSVLERLVACS